MSDRFHQQVVSARTSYAEFLQSTYAGNGCFRLTSKSDVSPFARCFAIFGCHLVSDMALIKENESILLDLMVCDLELLMNKRQQAGLVLSEDKHYLQLLTFTLSAFSIVNELEITRLVRFVLPLVDRDVDSIVQSSGALTGKPQSGNQAMFIAILLLHAHHFIGLDKSTDLQRWVQLHLESMNEFGFWESASSMSHLQFQNGYHQYEILDYLNIENPLADRAARCVASLADGDGHFAPYPGGGGCYDYDAIFVLTGATEGVVDQYRDLLLKTAFSILNGQNPDGGFCESHYVRPRTFSNMLKMVRHVFAVNGRARMERLRYCLTLQRPAHDRIHTHWSQYSRGWHESDLWDSWFRMLAVARIDVALHGKDALSWGFINYPGIGFHHSLRSMADS